jgi:hypothetical protein
MIGIILGIVGLAGGGGIVALIAKFGLNVVLGKAASLIKAVPLWVWPALAVAGIFAWTVHSRNHWKALATDRGDKLTVICQATRDAAGRPRLACGQVPVQIKLLGKAVGDLKGAIGRQNAAVAALGAKTLEQQAQAAQATKAAQKRADKALATSQRSGGIGSPLAAAWRTLRTVRHAEGGMEMTDLAWGLAFAFLIVVWLGAEAVGLLTSNVSDRDNERVQTGALLVRLGSVGLLVIVAGLLASCAPLEPAAQHRAAAMARVMVPIYGFIIGLVVLHFVLPMRARVRVPMLLWLFAVTIVPLLLSGCASTAPVQDRIVEVKIPVAVQPIKATDIPPVPPPLGPRPPTLRQSADKALAGWCEAVSYIVRADPLLRISAGGRPAPLPKYPECEGR